MVSPFGMHRRRPLVTRRAWHTQAQAIACACVALVTGLTGCDSRDTSRLTILSEPIAVTASASIETGEEGAYQFEIEKGQDRWTVPTHLGALWDARRQSSDRVSDRLKQLTAWKPPYLFLREENGGGNGWRADVDHVFKVTSNNVTRVGTVSAHFGPPGSQFESGRFADFYDRLEFTLLTSHASAPGFTLVMDEREGQFIVDSPATWLRGETRYKEAREQLRKLAESGHPTDSPAARREASAPALLCLAFTAYCGRETEYQSCLELAKSALGDIDDLRNEIESIVPGELAPSADQVLRANPALVNFFKESSAVDAPAPAIAPPPSVRVPVPAE